MKIDILTLFPDNMNAFLHESILGRAAKKGLVEIRCVQIRDFTSTSPRRGGPSRRKRRNASRVIMTTSCWSAATMRAWTSALSSSAWTRRSPSATLC